MMGAKEEYEARKRQQQANRDAKERAALEMQAAESALAAQQALVEQQAAIARLEADRIETEAQSESRRWWFRQKNPIDRVTGWLVVWTAALFIATIANAVILHSTDGKIKESYAAVQRPFVTARDIVIDQNMMPGYWMFGVRFENSGNTPTSEMEFVSLGNVIPPNDPEEMFRNPPPWVSKFPALIGPKAQDKPVGSQSGLPIKTLEELAKSRGSYYIRGVVHYRDLFKDSAEHVTKFCFAVIPYMDNFVLKSGTQRCLYWNCADNECKKDNERYEAAVRAANASQKTK
jgi:hypothetical protein